MEPAAPLILTLRLDERSFTFFNDRRRRFFPPERNFIPAHLTLFHHLPGERLPTIQQDIAACVMRQQPISLDVTGLRSLGRGVAYVLRSEDLAAMRRRLAVRWNDWLKPQDRQKHQPHVTVQNKVHPADARRLLDELTANFQPLHATGTGLDLWWYRGGPWELAGSSLFSGP